MKNTSLDADVSVEDGLQQGVLDLCRVNFKDTERDHQLTLSDAVEKNLLKGETAKELYAAMGKSSLSEYRREGEEFFK